MGFRIVLEWNVDTGRAHVEAQPQPGLPPPTSASVLSLLQGGEAKQPWAVPGRGALRVVEPLPDDEP